MMEVCLSCDGGADGFSDFNIDNKKSMTFRCLQPFIAFVRHTETIKSSNKLWKLFIQYVYV